MAIDFPDTRINNPETGLPWVNGDTFTDIPTGLTYYWFDPVWKREISVTGATDEKYVERAGDNMTGNLTLGDGTDDKITLDATDGGAEFAGDVLINDSNSGIGLQLTANAIVNNNSNSGSGIFVGNAAVLPAIATGVPDTNGSISFGTLANPWGSATFAGDVDGKTITSTHGLVNKRVSGVITNHIECTTDGFNNFKVDPSGIVAIGASSEIILNSNGDATFDGKVGVGNSSPRGSVHIGADLASGATDAAAINLKQTGTTASTGIYLERSGERRGYSIYLGSGQDSLTFQSNNVGVKSDVMALTRAGNVGIGTTNPLVNLDVVGSTSRFLFDTDATNPEIKATNSDGNAYVNARYNAAEHRFDISNNEAGRIDSSGRLLMGTTSAAGTCKIQLSNGNTAGTYIETGGTNRNGNGLNKWLIFRHGYWGGSQEVASIGVETTSSTGGSGHGYGSLVFHTGESGNGDEGSTSTERMRIDSNGNIRVFNATPSPVNGQITSGKFIVGANGWDTNTGSVAYYLEIAPSAAYGAGWGYSRANIEFTIQSSRNNQRYNFMEASWQGNVNFPQAISKGSGSFKIKHPLPEKKETQYLVHSFIEGPQADLIYRGYVTLKDGKATVNIDNAARMSEGTFVLLCGNVSCFTSNESDWTAVRGSVSENILTIEAQDPTSTAKVSWMVVGERIDDHMLETDWTDENGRVITEPLKASEETE